MNKNNIDDNLTSLENILIPEEFEEIKSQTKDGSVKPEENKDTVR